MEEEEDNMVTHVHLITTGERENVAVSHCDSNRSDFMRYFLVPNIPKYTSAKMDQ